MATIKRTASAKLSGTDIAITTQSGVLSGTPFSFESRFGDEKGTNPEELIAAALAGSFTNALAFYLALVGKMPESLNTTAELSMVQEERGWKIDAIALTTRGKVPGLAKEGFVTTAEKAKEQCPVSKMLNVKITLDAALE